MQTNLPGYESRWSTRGQAMVELAFVIFILLLFVFGITEFGRAMYTKNTLNNAARAGVRVAAVQPALSNANPATPYTMTFTSNDTCSYSATPIQQMICSSIFTMDKGSVTAVITVDDGSGPTTPGGGQKITVTTTLSNYQSLVPKLITITNSLQGEASMRYEQ